MLHRVFFTVTHRSHTYLKLELPVAEEGRLAQYFKTLVIIFDVRLLIIAIQIRIGLKESGQPLNISNNPLQSLLKWR